VRNQSFAADIIPEFLLPAPEPLSIARRPPQLDEEVLERILPASVALEGKERRRRAVVALLMESVSNLRGRKRLEEMWSAVARYSSSCSANLILWQSSVKEKVRTTLNCSGNKSLLCR
jgi:hypothetical protein